MLVQVSKFGKIVANHIATRFPTAQGAGLYRVGFFSKHSNTGCTIWCEDLFVFCPQYLVTGMVQWLRVEACDREVRVWSAILAVISVLVVVSRSSYPGSCRTGLKIPEVHCVFAHPTCSLKIPSASSQKVANISGHGYRARLEYFGLCCTLERITVFTLKTWRDHIHSAYV